MAIPSGALEQPAEYSDAQHTVEYALARGDAEPVARQTAHNRAGHPGPEEPGPSYQYQRNDRMAWPEGEPPEISIPAQISITGQYDRLQNTHGRGKPWTQRDTPSTRSPRTMDPALGDGSVLTRRSSRRAYCRSPAACAVTIAPRGAVRCSIRLALFLSSSERRIPAEAVEHGEEPPIVDDVEQAHDLAHPSADDR